MSKLAIRGGTPVVPSNYKWPAWPYATKADERRLLAVVRGTDWGAESPVTESFAERFAAYTKTKYALPVGSGTAALELAVKVLDIGPGDEVIIPAYTFVATATCVLELGATLVFADVDPDTWNLDPADVEQRITRRTRAIIPVHFAGNPANMQALKRITRGKKISIIEDAAHAHGMLLRGKAAGHFGAMAAYSFQTTKNMAAGEGGILVTNSKKLYNDAWSCHSFGRIPGGQWYEHHRLSWNHRLTALQAALLIGQLERVEHQTKTRLRNGDRLTNALASLQGITPQAISDRHATTRRAYHIFLWRHDEAVTGIPKARMIEALIAEGLPVFGGYPAPLQETPMMRDRRYWHCHRIDRRTAKTADEPDYSRVATPGTAQLCREAIWLPHELLLAPRHDMQLIVDAVAKVLKHADELC
jgi:dTDP-4-amino-4,6-dideoxygalactose transaminase